MSLQVHLVSALLRGIVVVQSVSWMGKVTLCFEFNSIVRCFLYPGSHVRQDSMEPSDFWDDVSNCRCGDRLMTLEQRANRQHQRCLAHSLVGTPNYIAPEVLLRKGGWEYDT